MVDDNDFTNEKLNVAEQDRVCVRVDVEDDDVEKDVDILWVNE
jgi:hypothetical protein